VTFLTSSDDTDATNLRSSFVTQHPELFQSITLSTSTSFSGNYSIGAPVQLSAGVFTLPGNLVGSTCQSSVQVLFGISRDVSCAPITV
jgi:hypothetical protein